MQATYSKSVSRTRDDGQKYVVLVVGAEVDMVHTLQQLPGPVDLRIMLENAGTLRVSRGHLKDKSVALIHNDIAWPHLHIYPIDLPSLDRRTSVDRYSRWGYQGLDRGWFGSVLRKLTLSHPLVTGTGSPTVPV